MIAKSIGAYLGSVGSVLLTAVVLLTISGNVSAQLSPPISPWMKMFDRNQNTGGLGNYLGGVKPQMDYQKALSAQTNQLNNLQQQAQAAMAAAGTAGGGLGTGGSGSQNLAGRAGAGLDPNNTLLQPPRMIPNTNPSAAYYNQHLHYYQSIQRRPVPYFSTGR